MEALGTCPACRAQRWRVLERVTYRREPPDLPADAAAARWEELRRDFFFRAWAPGLRELELSVLLCLSCGVVVFSPRPSERDVERKYEALHALGVAPGGSAESASGRDLDRRRSELVLTLLAERGRRPTEAPSVLDIGGGDGKLMSAFAQAGWRSFVVDYNAEPVRGVTRLGRTLADVPRYACERALERARGVPRRHHDDDLVAVKHGAPRRRPIRHAEAQSRSARR